MGVNRWIVAFENGEPIGEDFIAKLREPIALSPDQGLYPGRGVR